MIQKLLTKEQLKLHRKKIFSHYEKLIKKGKLNKTEIYELLAEEYFYKNGSVVFQKLRRRYGSVNPKNN